MKNRLRELLLFFIMSISFIACKDSGSPESITQLFLISLNKSDLVTARNISTKNTRDVLKIWAKLSEGQFSEAVIKQREENFKVKITKTQNENDSTAIVYFETQPAILPFDHLRLLKTVEKDGRDRWKVDISTLDLANTDNADTAKAPEGEQFHKQPDSVAAQE